MIHVLVLIAIRTDPIPSGFKGQSVKTANAVALVQGLTLHEQEVLLIELDPQASSTALVGYIPDAEIQGEMTIMPLRNTI
jgi:chromosome partitioning protein